MVPTSSKYVPLRSLLADPDQHLIKEMASHLHSSPLFRHEISPHQLQEAFASLDMLFIREEEIVKDSEPISNGPMRNRTARVELKSQQSRTWRYKSFELQDEFYFMQRSNPTHKRHSEAMVGNRNPQLATMSAKRRKRSSSHGTKGTGSTTLETL